MFDRSSFFTFILVLVLLPFSGCFLWDSSSVDDGGEEGDGSIARLAPSGFLENGGEYWESLTLDGRKIGYRQNKLTVETAEGSDSQSSLPRWESNTMMQLFQLDKVSRTLNSDIQLESQAGELLGFTKTIVSGANPVTFSGERENGYMLMKSETTDGHSLHNSIPWDAATGGPLAIQSSLARKPLTPGEKRSLYQYDIAFMTVNLEAKSLEKCEFPTGSKTLLRIEAEMIPDGETVPALRATFWADSAGIICRTEMPFLGKTLASEFCSKEAAIAEISEYPLLDIGPMAMFPLERPLSDPYGLSSITYLVQIEGEDTPANFFPATPLQNVRQVSTDSLEITVISGLKVDPAHPGLKTDTIPGREYIDPNTWLDYTSPSVGRLLGIVFPDDSESEQLRIAKILENFVHENLKPATNATAFASASDVANNLSGDCTEYAVLLAAMARAKGIPSRVVLGLVYTRLAAPDPEKSGAMAFHLWTELYIDGAWIPFDATLGRGGADAARIRIAESSLSGESFQSLLLKAFVLGKKIKINVVEEKR